MTRWRWAAITPEIELTLTLASDDPEMIERVETSARMNGIVLERLPDDWVMPSTTLDPLPADYWESAE